MATRRRGHPSSRAAPGQKKRARLVPVLAGLLVLAVVGFLATLSVRFDAAMSGEGGKTRAPRATASVARPTIVGQVATLPVRTAAVASPGVIAVGRRVEVAGTGADRLRVRQSPSASAPTVRIVPDGTPFLVTGGPEQAGGITWWRVDDQAGLAGWVAAQYLRPVP